MLQKILDKKWIIGQRNFESRTIKQQIDIEFDLDMQSGMIHESD